MKQKAKYILFLLLLQCGTGLVSGQSGQESGQNMAVESFIESPTDLDAKTLSEIDNNGRKCALIKIETSLESKDMTFDFGVLGYAVLTEQKKGEIWVYTPVGASYITISHTHLGVLRNHPLGSPVKEATVYYMKLRSGKVVTRVEEAYTLNYFKANCSIPDATIKIDNGSPEKFTDGYYSKRLPYGKHTYTVEAPKYKPEIGTVTISKNDMQTINISLAPNFSKITIIGDGDIYIDDIFKGSNTITEDLVAGHYVIELRKPSHRTIGKQIEVIAGNNQTLQLDNPVPIYGNADINSNIEADIYIDGKSLGKKSPAIITNVLIGKRNIELRADGYENSTQEINIEEGQNTQINFTLKLQPKERQIYFRIDNTEKIQAFLYINNQYQYTISNGYSRTVLLGKNNIEIIAEGYYIWKKKVNVELEKMENIGVYLESKKNHIGILLSVSASNNFTLKGINAIGGIGWKFNRYLDLQAKYSYWTYKYPDYSGVAHSVLLDFRYTWLKTKVSPYIDISGGYVFGDYTKTILINGQVFNKIYKENVLTYNAALGLSWRITPSVYLYSDFGYYEVLENFAVQLGFNFCLWKR